MKDFHFQICLQKVEQENNTEFKNLGYPLAHKQDVKQNSTLK